MIVIIILICIIILLIVGYIGAYYLERNKMKNVLRDIFTRTNTLDKKDVDCVVDSMTSNKTNRKLNSLVGTLCMGYKENEGSLPSSCDDYYSDISNSILEAGNICGNATKQKVENYTKLFRK